MIQKIHSGFRFNLITDIRMSAW